MWSLIMLFVWLIVLGIQLGVKEQNWGCLTALVLFFLFAVIVAQLD